MSGGSGPTPVAWRGLAGAVLGAVAAGVLAELSGNVDHLGAVLLAAIGSLLGWGLEGLFEPSRRRVSVAVVVVSALAAGVVAYISAYGWSKDDDGSTAAKPSDRHASPETGSSVTSGIPGTSTSVAPPSTGSGPPPGGDAEAPAGQLTFEWIPDAKRISHVTPTIDVFPRGHVDNGQLVDLSFDNLSVGAIEFDMFEPGGSTFTGWSRGSPANSLNVSYIFNPFTAGDYRLRIRDKETGAAAESSVYLDAGTGGPPIVEATGSSSATADVTVTGKGCDADGVNVVVEYTGAGSSDSYRLTMPDGQYVNGGLSVDSVGHVFDGLVLRSNRCTGTQVDGFAVVLLASDGSVRARKDFAVPN